MQQGTQAQTRKGLRCYVEGLRPSPQGTGSHNETCPFKSNLSKKRELKADRLQEGRPVLGCSSMSGE